MSDLTTPTLPLDLIHEHPDNPRRNAVADDEMVASIRAVGIAQAVTVMPNLDVCTVHPDVDCFKLGAGHRRRDGAGKAGLVEVPVVLREDLVTRAQQIAFMLVENFHRTDLTEGEVLDTFEQMTLEGFGPEDIAHLTGRSVATIKARLKLTGLGTTARERLVAGEMTLVDAETMLEFADDTDTTTRLEEALGTRNFQYVVQEARGRRARMERRAKIAETYAEAGATEAADDSGYVLFSQLPADLQDADLHDGCLGYRVPPSEWSEPFLVCTTPSKHPIPTPESPAKRQLSNWEKQQAERAERRARQATAAAVRVAWLRDHFTALFPVRSHGDLAKAAAAGLPLLIVNDRETVDSATLLAALGIDLGEDGGSAIAETAALRANAATIGAAKPTQVLGSFASYLAALVADQLVVDEAELLDDLAEVQYLLGLWDWLKTAGYRLSDVDIADRTALEVRHTELAAEAEEVAAS